MIYHSRVGTSYSNVPENESPTDSEIAGDWVIAEISS
jgi:hypothetical protein